MIRTAFLRLAPVLTVVLAASLLVAAPAAADAGRYAADIRRTEYGIPHISAKDHGGLGYGYGYAFAQDNLCVMASWVLTLRGERSRHFGAEATSWSRSPTWPATPTTPTSARRACCAACSPAPRRTARAPSCARSWTATSPATTAT
ncbi:penicillin acylase family protein [Nonomuraea wenchangensis]